MLSLVRHSVAKMKRGSKFLRKALRGKKRKPRGYQLWLEPLEDRALMAVSITGTVFQDLIANGLFDANEPTVPGIVAYLDTQAVTVNGTTTPALNPPPGTPATPALGANARFFALDVSGLNAPITDVNLSLNVSRGTGSGAVSLILLSPAGVVYGASTGTNNPPNNAGARLFALNPSTSFNGTIDDQAGGSPLGTVTTNLTGTFRPAQAFTSVDRLIYQGDANGTWYLAVENITNVTVNSWSLTFTEPKQFATTDANGVYSFSDLPAGPHTISIAVQNPPAAQNVNVVAGQPPVVANFAVAQPPSRNNSALTTDAAAQQQPSVAVNPTNPNHIVVAYMDYSLKNNGYAGIRVQTSTDGGQTWTSSIVPLPVFPDGEAEAAGYAKVVFDKTGANAYISFMAATFHGPKPPLIFPDGTRDPNTNRLFRSYGLEASNGVYLSKSTDGGASWGAPVAVSQSIHTPGGAKVNFFDAIPDITVDTTTAASAGNVYVTWTRIYKSGAMPAVTAGNGGTDIMIARKRPAEAGFTTMAGTGGSPTIVNLDRSAAFDEGGGVNIFSKATVMFNTGFLRVAINSGGRFRVVGINNPNVATPTLTAAPDVFFSTPQGSVGQANAVFPDLELYTGYGSHNFPVRGILADPFRPASVYMYDAIKINQGLSTTANQIDRGEIQFAWSLNNAGNQGNIRRVISVGGNTGNENEVPFNNLRDFTVPLNDDNDNRYLRFDSSLEDEVISTQAQPMMAIDAQGRLVAIWLDNRRDPNGKKFDIFGSVSFDGGLTWSPNFRVSDQGFDPENGKFRDALGNLNAFLGDSLGLAAAGGNVYAAWTDTRGGNQNIYFSKFSITPGVDTPNDRYEDNDVPASATVIGDVTAERTLVKLVLAAGEEDWYKVTPQGSKLFAGIQGSAAVEGLQFDLFDVTGTTLIAGGTDVFSGGQFVRTQIVGNVVSGQEFLLRVRGASTAAVDYTLTVNSLTEDLGATVYADAGIVSSLSNTISQASDRKIYAVTSVLAGSMEFAISITNSTGPITMEILSGDGLTVLQTIQVASGLSTNISQATGDGQSFLIVVRAANLIDTGSFQLSVTNLDQYQTNLRTSLFFATGATPTDLAAADLNNDGRLDLIASTIDPTSAVSVLRGTGLGIFWAAQGYKAGAAGSSREVVVDKFNGAGDSFDDVVVSNFASADVSLLPGLGDTTLGPERRSDATARALALAAGDFNGDGFKDLVVLERTPAPGATSNFSIILGRGDGTFGPPHKVATGFNSGANVVLVGDLNNDGKADIVVFGNNQARIEAYLGNGNGTFGQAIVTTGPEATAAALTTDINGDGKADLIVGGTNNGRVYVLQGLGDGTFGAAQSYFANTLSSAAASVAGIAYVDAGGLVGFGTAPDGIADIVVVTIPRVGNAAPHINFLAGQAGGTFGNPQLVRAGLFTGSLVAGDFNGDGRMDLAAGEPGGIRAVYGQAPTFPANTTLAAARDLGNLLHVVTPPQAISPSAGDSWFKLTVPTDVAGSGNQVLDFSALFQNVGGSGLGIEVVNAQGIVLATGTRFRLSAAQGETLFIHVFARTGPAGIGFGIYTLSIDVLPQVVGIQALATLPGTTSGSTGPVSSLLITIQGDRLDRATVENRANYRVIWFGADGIEGTADDGVIGLSTDANAVTYNQGANVSVSSGRTFAAATRQTITLNFDVPLPAGSYRIDVSGIQTDDFNGSEDSLLVALNGVSGHALVSVNAAGAISEGASVAVNNLVQPSGTQFDFSAIASGTPFLTQLHDDLGALLDTLLTQLGDDPTITVSITDQIRSRFEAAAAIDPQLTFMIVWFDPVTLSLEDPQNARTTYNVQTNTVVSNTARTYVEVGGNVQVLVVAGVSGTFRVNVADVQNTARGGALMISNGKVDIVHMTDAMRSGVHTFEFNVAAPPPTMPGVPGTAAGGSDIGATGIISSSVASLTTILVGLGEASGADLGATASANQTFIAAVSTFITVLIREWPEFVAELAATSSNLSHFVTVLADIIAATEGLAETTGTSTANILPGAAEVGHALQLIAQSLGQTGGDVGEAVMKVVRSRLNGAVPPVAPAAPQKQMPESKASAETKVVYEPETEIVPLRVDDKSSKLDALVVASLFAAGAINQGPWNDRDSRSKKSRKTLLPVG